MTRKKEPRNATFMKYILEKKENVLVITPDEESIDRNNARSFRDQAVALVGQYQTPYLILDLNKMTWIDSAGIGSLLSILRAAHLRGGEVKLCCVRRPVRKLIELVSAHKIFEIYSSSEEAMRSCLTKS